MNPYAVLDLDPSADEDDIKAAYRLACKREHPDRNPGDAGAQARFVAVGQAYAILGDPEKRARFDRFGQVDAAPSSGAGDAEIFARMVDAWAEFTRAPGEAKDNAKILAGAAAFAKATGLDKWLVNAARETVQAAMAPDDPGGAKPRKRAKR